MALVGVFLTHYKYHVMNDVLQIISYFCHPMSQFLVQDHIFLSSDRHRCTQNSDSLYSSVFHKVITAKDQIITDIFILFERLGIMS